MQVTKLKEEGTEFHAKIIISGKQIEKEVQKELIDLQKNFSQRGFRPGKVPMNLVTKKYPPSSVRNQVIQQQVNNSIQNVIKQYDLRVATKPKIEELKAEESQDVEFVLKLELFPLITMPDFSNITLEKPILKPSSEEINTELQNLAESRITYEKEKKGKAAIKDQVTIDAVGFIDGNEFEGGKISNHKLVLGSKALIDNFEEQLVGSSAGDEVLVKATFPENYQDKDVAGKLAEFKVNILSVCEPEKPKIDEEFAKTFNCNSVKELEDKITEFLCTKYNEQIHSAMKMDFFDKLETILDFDIPNSLLDAEYKLLQSQNDKLKKEDSELENNGPEELEKYYKKLASRRIRIGLLLSEYANDKHLHVTNDDIEKFISAEIKNFPGQEKVIIDFYNKNPQVLDQLHGSILEEIAVNHIFTNDIKAETKEYNIKELNELLERQYSLKKF